MAVRINYQEGDMIGALMFLYRTGRQGGSPLAMFRCECGKEFETRIESAKKGTSKSCGCKAKELQYAKKVRYENGHQFGDITLLRRLEGFINKPRGVFLCVCGVEFETRISAVVSGHTKSCGCYYIQTRTEPRNIYEIGEQIGTCFYMGDAPYRTGYARKATFRCHCGNYFVTSISNVEKGDTKSCGCSTLQYQKEAGSLPPLPMPILSEKDIERFWSMVKRTENINECWDWQRSGQKYGNFSHKRKAYKSNRIAYFIETGIDPKDMEVMHSCHRPKCCNPAHLSLGTHWDNMQDMKNSGRAFNGKILKLYKDY